jgi:major type 1 subunit fimbrin (pilin)
MNLKAITSALLIAGLAAPAAFATTGTITFNGSVSTVSCSVHGGDPGGGPDFTVNIAGVNANDMPDVGSNAGLTGMLIYIGGEATCTNGTKVWAHFEPNDSTVNLDGTIKASGSAQGVGFRVFDKLSNKINPWDMNQNPIKETVEDNRAILQHIAAFERTATTVTPGNATGRVTYSVRFEPATP